MITIVRFACFLLCIFIYSCMDRFVIPENIQSSDPDSFGAGDTTYLLLQPIWNSDRGIDKPVEISIAQDGRIFVADEAKQSILVFDQNGNRPEGFEDLLSLVDEDNIVIAPIDVDIDKKMNVFYIDGTQRIFAWNQYWKRERNFWYFFYGKICSQPDWCGHNSYIRK